MSDCTTGSCPTSSATPCEFEPAGAPSDVAACYTTEMCATGEKAWARMYRDTGDARWIFEVQCESSTTSFSGSFSSDACCVIEEQSDGDVAGLALQGTAYDDRLWLAENAAGSGKQLGKLTLGVSLTGYAYGDGGDDEIRGADNNSDYTEVLYGGDDNDNINSNNGQPSTIYGGGGDDILVGGTGDDTIYAGPGNDRLIGGNGDDTLIAGDGGYNCMAGGRGVDEITGGEASDFICGDVGSANGSVVCWNSTSSEHDFACSSSTGDVDTIDGAGGDDLIHGGPGADTITGGAGDDTVCEDSNGDTVNGNGDADAFYLTGSGYTIDCGTGSDGSSKAGTSCDEVDAVKYGTCPLSGLAP